MYYLFLRKDMASLDRLLGFLQFRSKVELIDQLFRVNIIGKLAHQLQHVLFLHGRVPILEIVSARSIVSGIRSKSNPAAEPRQVSITTVCSRLHPASIVARQVRTG